MTIVHNCTCPWCALVFLPCHYAAEIRGKRLFQAPACKRSVNKRQHKCGMHDQKGFALHNGKTAMKQTITVTHCIAHQQAHLKSWFSAFPLWRLVCAIARIFSGTSCRTTKFCRAGGTMQKWVCVQVNSGGIAAELQCVRAYLWSLLHSAAKAIALRRIPPPRLISVGPIFSPFGVSTT